MVGKNLVSTMVCKKNFFWTRCMKKRILSFTISSVRSLSWEIGTTSGKASPTVRPTTTRYKQITTRYKKTTTSLDCISNLNVSQPQLFGNLCQVCNQVIQTDVFTALNKVNLDLWTDKDFKILT